MEGGRDYLRRLMPAAGEVAGFSVLGARSFLDRVARRGEGSRLASAVGLAALAWLPLLIATLIEGLAFGWRGSFVDDVGVHVRLLLALPVAMWAERPIAARLDHAIRYLSEAGLIDDTNRAAAAAAIRRAERLRELPWLSAILVVIALALSAVNVARQADGPATWVFVGDGAISIAGWIYLLFSAPLFRFIALRWLWRVAVWTYLLVGLARAHLRLDAAHPDELGGLSVLTGAHASFGWITFALGVSLAGNLTTEKILLGRHVTDYWTEIITFVFVAPLVFLLPLFAFSWPIERARREGHAGYGSSSAGFARRYHRAWLDPATRKPLPLGTSETSAHTDLVTSFASVQGTRWIPFKRADYLTLLVPCLVPMLAFVLQEIPLIDVLKRLKDTIG